MTFYVDTSCIVAAITREVRSEIVIAWMFGQRSEALFTSDWVVIEVSSALSIKVRRGDIDEEGSVAALSQFRLLRTRVFQNLEFKREFFFAASRLAERHQTGLRAGDALHLAICAQNSAKLVTLDRRQSEAGLQLRIETLLL